VRSSTSSYEVSSRDEDIGRAHESLLAELAAHRPHSTTFPPSFALHNASHSSSSFSETWLEQCGDIAGICGVLRGAAELACWMAGMAKLSMYCCMYCCKDYKCFTILSKSTPAYIYCFYSVRSGIHPNLCKDRNAAKPYPPHRTSSRSKHNVDSRIQL
jgi:hypothetical protein